MHCFKTIHLGAGTALVTFQGGNTRLRKFRAEAGGLMTSALFSQRGIAKPGYLLPPSFSTQSTWSHFSKSELDQIGGRLQGQSLAPVTEEKSLSKQMLWLRWEWTGSRWCVWRTGGAVTCLPPLRSMRVLLHAAEHREREVTRFQVRGAAGGARCRALKESLMFVIPFAWNKRH